MIAYRINMYRVYKIDSQMWYNVMIRLESEYGYGGVRIEEKAICRHRYGEVWIECSQNVICERL